MFAKEKKLLQKFLLNDFKKLSKIANKEKKNDALEYNGNQLSEPFTKTKYKGGLKEYKKQDKDYLKSGQVWIEKGNKIYVCDGFGIQINMTTSEIYTGQWKNGLRYGKGIEKDDAGNEYIGNWKGVRFGYGKQVYDDGGIQEGIFEDVMDIGTEINLDGNEDYFLLNKIETYSFTKKKKGPRVYKGKLHYKDGSIYEGEFTSPNPGPNGKGKLTKINGEVIKGLWKHGEFFK